MIVARRVLLTATLGMLLALILAACGADRQTAAPAPTVAAAPTAALTPTAAPEPTSAPVPTALATTTGMGHGGMGDSAAPYDARFIDSMVAHHQSAIAMANQALQEAAKPEIKTLAQNIITAQQSEITQLQGWRAAWYPDLAPTAGLGMDMGAMKLDADTRQAL